MPWATSTRRQRLPIDWPTRRRAVKARAHGHCQAPVHVDGCDGIGTQCDHIVNNDDHSLTNLQWLSKACHTAKTQREAAQAKPSRRRQHEPNPGMR